MYTLEEIITKITPILRQYSINKAYIFGSYAQNCATEQSDIDILIDSGGELKGLEFVGLLEKLNTTLNSEIDLFDETHIEKNSSLYKQILNTGLLFYETYSNIK